MALFRPALCVRIAARAYNSAMSAIRPACLLVLCLSGAPLVHAQVNATGDYLAQMDKDGDGRVSLAEYRAWMSYAFEARDVDRDGVLSAQEQPGGRGAPITLVQHHERLADRFRRQDVDKDGFLSARELSAPPR